MDSVVQSSSWSDHDSGSTAEERTWLQYMSTRSLMYQVSSTEDDAIKMAFLMFLSYYLKPSFSEVVSPDLRKYRMYTGESSCPHSILICASFCASSCFLLLISIMNSIWGSSRW